MARWRLTAPHYLNVPGTEYEHREINTDSGVMARKVFEVPVLLDPNTPGNSQRPFNYPGEYVVCHEGKGQARDIAFIGNPTPDMVPLDEEATAISASLASKWQHPVDSIGNEDYGAVVFAKLEQQMAALMARVGGGVSPSTVGVSAEEFAKLQEQVAALMARNAELEAQPKARRA